VKPDDLNGVPGLTIGNCSKVTLPVNKLEDRKWIFLENINAIDFIHSENNTSYNIQFTNTSNFAIKNSTLRKFLYKASKPSTIGYLSFEGVKVTEEIVFSNIEIHTLEISNCEINKIRQEAFDVKVTNVLKIQNNAFKEVESNAFKKLR
jgi:hypothetical protein